MNYISEINLPHKSLCSANHNVTLPSCARICLKPETAFSAGNWAQCWEHLKMFGKPPRELPTSYGPAFLSMINGCMRQYCEVPDPAVGGCPYEARNYTDVAVIVESQGLHYWDSIICSRYSAQSRINPDIGGIGVSLPFPCNHKLYSILNWRS